MVNDAFDAIKGLLGDTPFPYLFDADLEKKTEEQPVTTVVTKNVVLKDGTYATVTSTETVGATVETMTHLRKNICTGYIMLGTVTCVCLTKLALKAKQDVKRLTLSALVYVAGVGRLAEIKKGARVGVNSDSLERLTQCSRLLLDPKMRSMATNALLSSGHSAFSGLVARSSNSKGKAAEDKKGRILSQADDLIQFRQLRAQAVQGGLEVDLMDADDISRAVGTDGASAETARLKHVYQLTGYSDPVYAEASVTVHDYDIVLEMLIINRTPNTLTNLTVELATMGDLKLVERPQSYTIGPLDERRLRANIKVSSTETSHIFGTIVFDNSSTAQKTYVNLNDIQLDIMDYIRPAECKNEDFRHMWAEFEWENKVAVNTNITNLREFVSHIITNTNMTCLTPLDDQNLVIFADMPLSNVNNSFLHRAVTDRISWRRTYMLDQYSVKMH
jgi:coatomer subunit beta